MELFRLALVVDHNESISDAAARIFCNEELASYAVKSAIPGQSVQLALGNYICLELIDVMHQHLGPIPDGWEGEINTDVFTVICAIRTDEALNTGLGRFVNAAEESMARFCHGRLWIGGEFDPYTEDGRTNGDLSVELASIGIPEFDLAVAKVYDPQSGCYSRPFHSKIVRVALHDGRLVRVAFTAPGYGLVLLENKKLTLQNGVIDGDANNSDKESMELLCKLLIDNSYYAMLDPKRRK